MKQSRLFIATTIVFASVLASSIASAGSHHVKGHTTKKGTYVEPTRATDPDKTKVNNYSTKGNVNPYSGKKGTKDPYKPNTPKRRK